MWSYVLEVPDVDFIRLCGVVVFALFYCHLDLCCGECYVGCLQFECVPVYVSVGFGEVSVFSLNVMVLFLGCVWDPSVCLGVPSICHICVFV